MGEHRYIQGRLVGKAELDWVRRLIEEHGGWSRKRLSQELCRQWGWCNAHGVWKDFAARSFLLKLAERMLAAGYELEPGRRIGFTVKGVPPELRDAFSKRRHEILRQAAAAGATSQDELQNRNNAVGFGSKTLAGGRFSCCFSKWVRNGIGTDVSPQRKPHSQRRKSRYA